MLSAICYAVLYLTVPMRAQLPPPYSVWAATQPWVFFGGQQPQQQ